MARDRASRPQARPLRLFVAVDVPQDVRDALARQVAALHPLLPEARWVPPENWHVTLTFLGRTWPRLVGWVREQLAAVAAGTAPIETSVRGVGAFASWRRARVLWVGLAPDGEVCGLEASVADALAREFRPEKRAFTPHLTLARLDPPVPVDEASFDALAPSRGFTVNELVLYQSHLRRPAPVYEVIDRFPLAASPVEGR